MEIYLIRHTTPEIAKGICYGQSDIALASTFEDEWNTIRDRLPEKIDAVYSSPLSRCRQLASKLGDWYGIPFIEDRRLAEMNFGEWELKRWDNIEQVALQEWMNNFREVRCPGGESYRDVLERVSDFVQTIQEQADKSIMIVTHGGVIKCFDTLLNQRDGMMLQVHYGEMHVCRILSGGFNPK
jgi:alpha-ribazole phosphatase